jgi:hypothetical protein
MGKVKFLITYGPDSYTTSVDDSEVELWSFNGPAYRGRSYALCTWYDGALRLVMVSPDDVDSLEDTYGSVRHVGANSKTAAGRRGRRELQLLARS